MRRYMREAKQLRAMLANSAFGGDLCADMCIDTRLDMARRRSYGPISLTRAFCAEQCIHPIEHSIGHSIEYSAAEGAAFYRTLHPTSVPWYRSVKPSCSTMPRALICFRRRS